MESRHGFFGKKKFDKVFTDVYPAPRFLVRSSILLRKVWRINSLIHSQWPHVCGEKGLGTMIYHNMLLVIVRFLWDFHEKAGIGTAPHGAGNAWRSGVRNQGIRFTDVYKLRVSQTRTLLASALVKAQYLSNRHRVWYWQSDLHTYLPGSTSSDFQALWPSLAIPLRVYQRIFKTLTSSEFVRKQQTQ